MKNWTRDFEEQPVKKRPALEVRYTDASREAFEIVAGDYHLLGELRKPHRLRDSKTSKPWLWFEMEDAAGKTYSTKWSGKPSRINLYRRGPYYCEVHWLDIQVADQEGEIAPIKGDLALYCYPEKILASITWHGVGELAAKAMKVQGIAPAAFKTKVFKKGVKQTFSLPLFGEPAPLADSSFKLLTGAQGVKYDRVRGCYMVGTNASGGFQGNFYDFPNRYETATFSVRNDSVRRKIYICHESVKGGGCVEGGIVLDEAGHPMPIVTQISKNFSGEKEERFYNPRDTAFSETFFPLYLEPNETGTLSSLHLYQNWGRHATKHWSSLGAWMDYFHSSTGVTETTCYVPFKFAGVPGVSIADFRAMSQETFWGGQPQHDNVAGHSFLSYFDGKAWRHSIYRGTTYRSTGPNWFDIGLEYLSADGKIRTTVDAFEFPQADELRSFIRVRYQALKPLTIQDARANFRLLNITTRIQSLRYTHFAATGHPDAKIDYKEKPFPFKGAPIPAENSFLAMYGERKGSNAIVIRRFKGPNGIGAAATLQLGPYKNVFNDRAADTRLILVPDADTLNLKPGDAFEVEGFWLPYGEMDGAETPRREVLVYGPSGPKVVEVTKGKKIADFPTNIRVDDNEAEFTIRGGRELIPVMATGLTNWRWPRIWRKEGGKWRMLSHARVGQLDGVQVFSEGNGSFGAIFLVYSNDEPQTLRVTAGREPKIIERIRIKQLRADHPTVQARTSWLDAPIQLHYPKELHSDDKPSSKASFKFRWRKSEAKSLWFQGDMGEQIAGGRVTPNEDCVDLEFWWQNKKNSNEKLAPSFSTSCEPNTLFDDLKLERTWIRSGGKWKKMADIGRRLTPEPGFRIVAVRGVDEAALKSNSNERIHLVDFGVVAVAS